MLNIVIPMAGRGSRFAQVGYILPKPLVAVHDTVPMIRLIIENLRPRGIEYRYIFLCLQDHLDHYDLPEKLKAWAGPNSIIVPVNTVTEGAACTVLLAKEFINTSDSLMIANSDQWVDIDINDYLSTMESSSVDGLIMTMWADHPKWSYVRLDSANAITEVVEKQVVSNEATVGIYNFRHGADFVNASEAMIAKNLRVNNEFYVAPAYNELIAAKKKLAYYNVGKEYDGMYGLGTPEDLIKFEAFPVSQKALATVSVKL